MVGGGAALGVVFCLLERVPQKLQRLAYCFLMAAAVASGLLFWFGQFGDAGQKHILRFEILFAAQLAAAVVFFYILTFAGREDESEVEIAVVCAGLAVSLGLLAKHLIAAPLHYLIYLVPVALYFVYVLRTLPWLRVVKHAFRGLSYAQVGRHRRALQSFRRALQFDPQNQWARAGYWDVHRSLDLNQLAGDPQTLALVDLDLCLDRAGGLLLQDKPNAAQLAERMRCLIWRSVYGRNCNRASTTGAVAHTHARRYDEAAEELGRLLDPLQYGRDNPQRKAVIFQAWQLALTLSGELRRRVGDRSWHIPAGAWKPSPWSSAPGRQQRGRSGLATETTPL